MGDIAFNIFKDVDLNKTVDLDINKNVDVNVNITGQLATAEADAEAFGPNALAEVDAYTFVSEEKEPVLIANPGSVDALGNTLDFLLQGPFSPNGAAETITVIFNDVDDISGFGSLAPLSSPPPDTPDVPIPDPLFAVPDLVLESTGLEFVNPDGDLAAQYELASDFVINFGERTLDLDGDGVSATGDLLLTIPEDTLFLGQYLEAGAIEVEFESFVDNDGDGLINTAFFTFDDTFEPGPTEFPVTDFIFELGSTQTGSGGDFAVQAESLFGHRRTGNGGRSERALATAYVESTAALDLNGGGLAGL